MPYLLTLNISAFGSLLIATTTFESRKPEVWFGDPEMPTAT